MFMYYTACYFTGIFYAVVRQISMLFIDNKDSVFCIQARDSPLRSTFLASAWLDLGLSLIPGWLFTFLSRWPIVTRLRASGRNWFRTVITTTEKTSQEFLALPFVTC